MMCGAIRDTSLPRQQASVSTSSSITAGAAAAGQQTAATPATGGSPDTITTSSNGSSLAEWILPFGGHAGKPIGQVPDGYLHWMIGKGVFHRQAQAELDRRATATLKGD